MAQLRIIITWHIFSKYFQQNNPILPEIVELGHFCELKSVLRYTVAKAELETIPLYWTALKRNSMVLYGSKLHI